MQPALRHRAAAGTVGPRGGSLGGLERARKAPRRRWRCASGLAARGGLDAGDAVLWVRDALVVHAEEELAEGVLDALDVTEREVALVMRVLSGLVLDERGRVPHLSDVVVVGAHSGHEWIGADDLGGALGKVPDEKRVVIRAGCAEQKLPQERMVRIAKLAQLEHGRDAEDMTEDGRSRESQQP